MDQLKVFLRQCVKYRFWIAVGISLLLPMIGYLVGSPEINKVTDTQVALIKGQQGEIAKYQAPDPPNADYKKLVDEKKAALSEDVDAAHRKLYATQEPLLKWPAIVETDFRKWGRKWPENIDAGKVRQTIVDYSIAYPDFVTQVYSALNAWNPEDGTGIVYVPKGRESIVKPSPLFNPDNPPELGKVWAEQEKLWIITAMLDTIAKINDAVGAKDWDGAVVKQINVLDVASPTAQDQRSMAKGVTLDPAPAITAPGAAAAPAAPAGPSVPGGPLGAMGGSNQATDEVYSLKPESPNQPFKIVPIRLSVLVDQERMQNFLVGLENSPMAIQVMEVEFSRPAGPVEKPVYGETTGAGGYSGGVPDPSTRMAGPGSNRPANGPRPGGAPGGRPANDEPMGMGRGPGGMGAGATKKGGTDVRSENKAEERKQQKAKEAAKAKANPARKLVDQYYNIVEVTVYGQARFYNAPPPLPASESSRAPEPPKADAPKSEPTKPPEAHAPKPETKADAPKAEAPKPEAPKADAPKADAPKADAPKVEGNPPSLGGAGAPKAEGPAPKSDAPPKKP